MKLDALLAKPDEMSEANAVRTGRSSEKTPGPNDSERSAGLGGSTEEIEQSEVVMTPSGIEILYSWAPKRLYRLAELPECWIEVPSVTNVLKVLDKSGALTWWGMKVGVAGYMTLVGQDIGPPGGDLDQTSFGPNDPVVAEVVSLLTEHKLTVNHVLDQASDRGTNVHKGFEAWAETFVTPAPNQWPEHERGYVRALGDFLATITPAVNRESVRAEVMVGSPSYRYAGRCDLELELTEPVEVVTRIYPKRKDKIETIPAGRYRFDVKTSKGVYDTHYLQNEAYEYAAVECGYEPTDDRGIIHCAEDGRYELCLNSALKIPWTFEDFVQVRQTYAVMSERAQLAGERETEQALVDELGATEITKPEE